MRELFGTSSEAEECSSTSTSPDVPQPEQESSNQGFVTVDLRSYSQIARKTPGEQLQEAGIKRTGLKVLLPEKAVASDPGKRMKIVVFQDMS